MSEVARAIGKVIAKRLILTFGEKLDGLTILEYVGNELPGADGDLVDLVAKFVEAYIEVADVGMVFHERRVGDDGTLLPEEEDGQLQVIW